MLWITRLDWIESDRILFHDLLLSPISQHSVWNELTCYNSLHCTVTKRGHNRDQAWSQFSLDARCNVTAQREQQYNETQSNFL